MRDGGGSSPALVETRAVFGKGSFSHPSVGIPPMKSESRASGEGCLYPSSLCIPLLEIEKQASRRGRDGDFSKNACRFPSSLQYSVTLLEVECPQDSPDHSVIVLKTPKRRHQKSEPLEHKFLPKKRFEKDVPTHPEQAAFSSLAQ